MRVSCNRSDPGYANYIALGKRCRVYVNGVEVDSAVMADEELGVVSCVHKEGGRFTKPPRHVLRRGVVRVTAWHDEKPSDVVHAAALLTLAGLPDAMGRRP
ncbi:MAG: hypothetical protein ACRCYZ_06885 [Alphaproteobacteria bacterium]